MKRSKFKIYFAVPFVSLAVILLADIIVMRLKDSSASVPVLYGALAIALIILSAGTFLYVRYFRRNLVEYGVGFNLAQKEILSILQVPYAVLDSDTTILWSNYEMQDILDEHGKGAKKLNELFPNITKTVLPTVETDVVFHSTIDGHYYKIILSAIDVPAFDRNLEKVAEQNSSMIAAYMYDETEIENLKVENFNMQMIIGLLYIDNYDEVLEVVDEVKRSLLTALVDRKLNRYMQSMNAVFKKLENDKYLFIFQKKYLADIKKTGRELLADIKKVSTGNTEVGITISMGLGITSHDYAKSYEYARAAIDLALGRGGDQIVIKEGDDITYIGGNSASIEKSTRVTARVKAHAMRELIEAHDDIFIMGHSISDTDAVGSAIGIYRIASSLGKNVHIVLNETNAGIAPIVNAFNASSEYPDDMFIGNIKAQEMARPDALLIVVDVNRPVRTECPELFDLIQTVIVLDHHRVTGDSIKHSVLSYIEPYASSASEMVAEILQYMGDDVRLRPIEAEALYTGIVVDTNNFITKSGVRTFEAAAFLRKNGVDITRVRKAFRSDMNEYVTKARAVSSTEMYMGGFAFAECKPEAVETPTVLGAQIANDLLNIKGIKASFVFTDYNGKVYISARSIDEVNVQIIMEKLGGGGHLNIAGAQLEGVTIKEAEQRLKQLLSDMTANGEL